MRSWKRSLAHLTSIAVRCLDASQRQLLNWLPYMRTILHNVDVACGNAGKTLTLTEFLQSLHLSQIKQLRNRVTAKTYKPPPLPNKKGTVA